MGKKAPPEAWLFAYGSLVGEGAAAAAEERAALLRGYHRALCIYSHVYRGTRRRPGLVLGLERGGSCRGVAVRFHARKAGAAMQKIIARENVTGVYELRRLPVTLAGESGGRARRVRAFVFVAKRDHPQYAGKLPLPEVLRLLRQGRGTKGRACDYLRDVLLCLELLGIPDRGLERIARLIGRNKRRL